MDSNKSDNPVIRIRIVPNNADEIRVNTEDKHYVNMVSNPEELAPKLSKWLADLSTNPDTKKQLDNLKEIMKSVEKTKDGEQLKKLMEYSEQIAEKGDYEIDNVCYICYEDMHEVYTLPCKHKFHHQCLKKMFFLHMKDQCPMCRAKFTYKITGKVNKKKQLLRTLIIKHLSSGCGRMPCNDVMELGLFLHEHDIHFKFLSTMARIMHEADATDKFIDWSDHHIHIYKTGCCSDEDGSEVLNIYERTTYECQHQ